MEEQGQLTTDHLHPQPKQFRKMIQQTFQQYASLREEECVMKFFNTLAGFANIDQETYRCELIVMTRPLYSLPDPNSMPLGMWPMWGAQEGTCWLIATHTDKDP